MRAFEVLLLAAPGLMFQAQDHPAVSPDPAIVRDFDQRVADYAKLRQTLESQLPALKPADSQEKIVHHEHELARKIQKAREQVNQGAIFTAPIAAEFRRLIGLATQGSDGAHVHESLRSAEPVQTRLRVNQVYPANLPVQSTPPTILLNLPTLPSGSEYRLVGHELVLLDSRANLIIDIMPAAIK
jgi:hypothetical protein